MVSLTGGRRHKTGTQLCHILSAFILFALFLSQAAHAQDNPLQYEWGDRDARQNPEHVMDFMGLKQGDSIADIGAGGGYFTLRFAERVGAQGRVTATDIKKHYLEFIEERVREAGFDNVHYLVAALNDPRLGDRKFDYIFLSSVYHHLNDPAAYLAGTIGNLKPDGKLVIVENKRSITPHGSDFNEVVKQMSAVGFELHSSDQSQHRFFIAIFISGG